MTLLNGTGQGGKRFPSSTCPECGKGLGSDDAYGHDCEVK